MGGSVDGKEAGDEKKLDDEMVAFLRKRSETEGVCCATRFKSYMKIHDKRKRADTARRHATRDLHRHKNEKEPQDKNKSPEAQDKHPTEKTLRSGNRSLHSVAPAEACGCRRKRRRPSCRRRRRRSCRRRRRRSCRRRPRRRRSCRRRRRRSCSRRRRRNRRRSCRRRRRCG